MKNEFRTTENNVQTFENGIQTNEKQGDLYDAREITAA